MVVRFYKGSFSLFKFNKRSSIMHGLTLCFRGVALLFPAIPGLELPMRSEASLHQVPPTCVDSLGTRLSNCSAILQC